MSLCELCARLDFSRLAYRKKEHGISSTIALPPSQNVIDDAKTKSASFIPEDYGNSDQSDASPAKGSEEEEDNNIEQADVAITSDDSDDGSLDQDCENPISIDVDNNIVSIYSQPFGPVCDIGERRDHCVLCELVSRHFQLQGVGQYDTYEIMRSEFGSAIFRRKDILHLSRMAVVVTPQIVNEFLGPFLPHEEQAASLQQPRCILELQDCSDPTPTTGAFKTAMEKSDRTALSGRLMPSSKADLGLFAEWFRICREYHGARCSKPFWLDRGPTSDPQPLTSLLVIDVNKMCIVSAPDRCHYVALSYCWGTTTMLTHTVANSESLKAEGALEAAATPATIKDAISVVKGVGERYIWVDALCIVQDDFEAKQTQLAQMGLIYSLAIFTIIAASGSDSNAGLPGVRIGTRNNSQEVLEIRGKKLIPVIDGAYYGGVQSSSWNTRAWTMQEKVLSKRKLIFTDQQVYWDCWSADWLEETVLENVSSFKFMRAPSGKRSVDLDLSLARREYYRFYEAMVQVYLHRNLTFQSDILNAFSGISQALANIRHDRFHWGLPTSRFDWALSWRLIGGGIRNGGRHTFPADNASTLHIPFPSWSWTAWMGGSNDSWIGWNGSTRRLRGEPEIIFYHEHTERRLARIEDDYQNRRFVNARTQSFMDASKLLDLREQWKGHPRTIPEASQVSFNEPFDTGRLHFWTSSANLYIRRGATKPTHGPSFSDIPSYTIIFPIESDDGFLTTDIISIESSAHLPFQDINTMAHAPDFVLKHIENDETSDVFIKEFVVVGRARWVASPDPSRCRTYLSTLIVERKGDVAYRIGQAVIEEPIWAKLPNKEWKRMILG